MTKLSVNVNKIATLRNSRGANVPDVIKMALDIETYGAEGITVHPRPDQRHIRYQDVRDLKKVLTTEFNIEGNPIDKFIQIVEEVRPTQVTLVPDSESQLTSNCGWDTIKNKSYLTDIIARLKQTCRVSVFVNADPKMVCGAKECGADRVELYTESYASDYTKDREKAIEPFVIAAREAGRCGLGLNAGHDLSLENLHYFKNQISNLDEVSIGHALISDALYYGMANTVQMYKRLVKE